MKYYKRLGIYKASNLTLDLNKGESYSYRWYLLAKKIKGEWVLNTYNYSRTTTKHKNEVDIFLQDKIKYFIDAPKGLQNLNASIKYYNKQISNVLFQMIKPRARKKTNIKRKELIEYYKGKIKLVKQLQKEGL